MKLCRICGDEAVGRGAFCAKVEHYRPCKNCGKDYLVKKVVKPPEFCGGSCGAKYRNRVSQINKNCKLCGDEFIASNSNAKVCSKKHFKACQGCHEQFEILNHSRIRDYCSQRCSVTGKTYELVCKRCGENFTTTNSMKVYCDKDHYSDCIGCGESILLKNPKRLTKYCSISCSSKDREFTLICQDCGLEFQSKTGAAKICSRPHKNTCLNCGKVYTRTSRPLPSVHKSQTCSPECTTAITNYNERNKKGELTLMERYGVSNAFLLPGVADSSPARVSKLNRRWAEKLEKALGVTVNLEVKVGQYYFDLEVNGLLIDINPTISHNSTISFPHAIGRCTDKPCTKKGHQPKPTDSHQRRFLAAEKAGKTLLQYFDWMDEKIFISIIRSKLHLDEHKVRAKKCDVKEIPQSIANKFLKENHLLGGARKQTFCVGVFFEGDLVHVQTYGPARMSKKFEWEAIRSCSKMGWHVQGGLQKCDKYFMRKVSPGSIVSYVDLALGGGSAESLNPGWSLVSTNRPSGTWVRTVDTDTSGPLFVKAASARLLSADKLLGFEVGSRYPVLHEDGSKFTNDDVLVAEGYVQAFDVGTRTFGWRAPAN